MFRRALFVVLGVGVFAQLVAGLVLSPIQVEASGAETNLVSYTASGGVIAAEPPDAGEEVEETEATCEGSVVELGWLICPITRFLLGGLESIVGGTLFETVLKFDMIGSQNAALRSIWVGFRDIANLGFVIVFFILIYSQASGTVLSAYDIKRLMPRLLLGAIFVQLSFFICLQLVELFNALGDGIADLLLAPVNGGGVENLFQDSDSNIDVVSGVVQSAASLLTILLLVVAFVFALMGVFLMIIMFLVRNMALVVLTVISPIAFVAWILPNTDGVFRKWWQYYIQLLALYPIAMAFLASGKLISSIWAAGDGFASRWVGIIAMFAPYIFAPKMFQFAGQAVGGIVRGVEGGKNKIRGSSIGQRAETNLKGSAAGRFANSAAGQRVQKMPGVGNAARGGLARQVEAKRRLEDTDRQTSEVMQKKGVTDARAKATKAAQARGVTDPQELRDEALTAEKKYLTDILDDPKAKDHEKRAAFSTLAKVHSNDGEVAGKLTGFVNDMKGSDNKSDQELGEKVVQENLGELLNDIPQAVRGYGGAAAQSAQKVLKWKGGAAKDFTNHTSQTLNASSTASVADQASQRSATHDLGRKYVEGAENDSLRGDVTEGNAKQAWESMLYAHDNMVRNGMNNPTHPQHAEYLAFSGTMTKFQSNYDVAHTTSTDSAGNTVFNVSQARLI